MIGGIMATSQVGYSPTPMISIFSEHNGVLFTGLDNLDLGLVDLDLVALALTRT